MAKRSIKYTPQTLDLELYAGDGSGLRFKLVDTAGEPLDVSGTVRAQIRASRDAVDPPLATFSIDQANASTGIVLIYLTGEITQELAPEEKFEGVWDLEWTPTNSEPLTLCQGKVECFPDVSH